MGFMGKLLGIGLTAAAAVVVTKVAKKYMENQQDGEYLAHGVDLDEEDTCNCGEGSCECTGSCDCGDECSCESKDEAETGETEQPQGEEKEPFEERLYQTAEDVQDVLEDVAHAAGDVWDETKEKATKAAGEAGVDTDQLSESLADAGRALALAGKAVFAAGSAVAQKVAHEAPGVIDKVRNQTGDWLEQMKTAVNTQTQEREAENKPQDADDTQTPPQE